MPRNNIPISWKVRFVLDNADVVNRAFSQDYFDNPKEARRQLLQLAIEKLGYSAKTAPQDIFRSLKAARYWTIDPKRLVFINSEGKERVWFNWSKPIC